MAFGDVIRWGDSPRNTPAGIGGDANTIWLSDYPSWPNKVYELSTTDFSSIRSADTPAGGAQGMGGDANTIWLSTIQFDKLHELSTTDLSEVRNANAPSTSPFGIGGDANTIWHCDSNTDLIYELSTTDFSVDRSGNSPSSTPTGIGGNANTIWHCDYNSSRVYELSTTDFSTLQSAFSPAGNPRGIGGDTNTLWHCDQNARRIYELVEYGVVLPAVQTNAATDIQLTSAQLHGYLIDDGGEACDCWFEHGVPGGTTYTTPLQTKSSGELFSQALTGLTPGTRYQFRAVARNSTGITYGTNMYFVTESPPLREFPVVQQEILELLRR